MIFTVFVNPSNPELQWQSELLGFSWGRAQQPGELVRLVAAKPVAPCHPLARDFSTMNWVPHPYTSDGYEGFQTAAALHEWLFVDRPEGTVLLLEPTSVIRCPIVDEVKAGEAKATAWNALPRGEGPFGLHADFEFLNGFCVERGLTLPAVKLPVLIHTSDLRKIATRWLELMGILRAETSGRKDGPMTNAYEVAYAIAAAEAGVAHTVTDLGGATDASSDRGSSLVIDYRAPIAAVDGTIAWDAQSYRDFATVDAEQAKPGVGREFLTLLSEFVMARAQGIELSLLKPRRIDGVREGKILDTVFLEIPGRAETVSLNSSGAAIWEVCDGNRSLGEIITELERRFDMPMGSLRGDIEGVVKHIERIGALRLTAA